MRWSLYCGLAVAAGGSITLVVLSQLAQVSDVDMHLKPWWLIPAAIAFALLQLSHAQLWRLVLSQLGSPIDLRRGIAIWNATVLARYVPTSLLTPIMRAALAEPAGVPRRVCLVSTIYELALAFVGALVLSVYFLLQLPADFFVFSASLEYPVEQDLHVQTAPADDNGNLAFVKNCLGRLSC